MKYNFKKVGAFYKEQNNKTNVEIMKSVFTGIWDLWIGEEQVVQSKNGHAYKFNTLKEAIEHCESANEFITEKQYFDRRENK